MKIACFFLLATGLVLDQTIAEAQSVPPASQYPSVNQSSIQSTQPVPSIWQPFPATGTAVPGYNRSLRLFSTAPLPATAIPAPGAPRWMTAPTYQRPSAGSTRRLQQDLSAELPPLNYDDLQRDKDGRLQVPPAPAGLTGNAPQGKLLSLTRTGQIRSLPPDNMPCLTPNPALVEAMPIDRRRNADPINRMGAPYRIEPTPRRPASR
jgi:hypothetical protein